MKTKSPFSVGNCHVSPFENKLNHADNECILQPKFIELLCFLTECYPHAVTREELIDNVWDGNQFVGEKALTNAIWHLRKALVRARP
ncbi:winged helix-turn-helix domain-containing protein [Pseudoalteromonas nigrifaciens]|uniref:winged helix-turn-helix domain-containing protein n=1 Tax=Pseudoalteromonas nigrifaciens TaxID=28109 RepID=UPI003FD63A3C